MTQLQNRHIPKGFTAEDLFVFLSQLTLEQRQNCEVFIRVALGGAMFNITSLTYVEVSKYGFFGKPQDCVILNEATFAPSYPPEDLTVTKSPIGK